MEYKVVGQKGILVQLRELQKATVTESGVHIPAYQNYTTDGGRPASELSSEKYAPIGVVLQVSDKAKEILEQEMMDVNPGDTVAINPGSKHPSFWFIEPNSLTQPVNKFDGKVLIHPNSIQCKILNDVEQK